MPSNEATASRTFCGVSQTAEAIGRRSRRRSCSSRACSSAPARRRPGRSRPARRAGASRPGRPGSRRRGRHRRTGRPSAPTARRRCSPRPSAPSAPSPREPCRRTAWAAAASGGHRRVRAAADGLAAPHLAEAGQVLVEPLAPARRAVPLGDEVVRPGADSKADRQPAIGHPVDPGQLLRQQRPRPRRAQQDAADQLGTAGHDAVAEERHGVERRLGSVPADRGKAGEARVLGLPGPAGRTAGRTLRTWFGRPVAIR